MLEIRCRLFAPSRQFAAEKPHSGARTRPLQDINSVHRLLFILAWLKEDSP